MILVLGGTGLHREIYARAVNVFLPTFGCTLVSVTDGDTVRAFCPGVGTVPVRLLGYDTPEVWSPSCAREWLAGTRATLALRWRLFSASEVSFVLSGTDRYKRRLGTMFVDGRNIAQYMIAEGHAAPYQGGKRRNWCLALAVI